MLGQMVASSDLSTLEERLRASAVFPIVGVDEAGRGPLAGPVVVCACCLPNGLSLKGLKDSKACSAKERERLYHQLTNTPDVLFTLSIISHEEIDKLNIFQATMKGIEQVIDSFPIQPQAIFVDGNHLPKNLRMRDIAHAIVKGDALLDSISAASIIAKVTRDRRMEEYDLLWPHFQFRRHKGYATELHLSLLEQYGPLPIHRRSFAPVRECMRLQEG